VFLLGLKIVDTVPALMFGYVYPDGRILLSGLPTETLWLRFMNGAIAGCEKQ
jgi:hypothetical protein